jgi:hypothetical protein
MVLVDFGLGAPLYTFNHNDSGAQTPLSLFFDQRHLQQIQRSGIWVEFFNGFGGCGDQNATNP